MTLVIMFSDLRLGDLNYLLSVKPTPQRQGHDGLLLIAKQTFTLLANSRLISTQSGQWLEYLAPYQSFKVQRPHLLRNLNAIYI